MHCVGLAESAILFGLHTLRMILLFLRHVVISLLALSTCQCNSYTHNFHLHISIRVFLRSKKKTSVFHTPLYNIIRACGSQGFFVDFQAFSIVSIKSLKYSSPHKAECSSANHPADNLPSISEPHTPAHICRDKPANFSPAD